MNENVDDAQISKLRENLTENEQFKIILNIINKVLLSQIVYLSIPTLLLFFFNAPFFDSWLLIRIALPIFTGATLFSFLFLLISRIYKKDYPRNNWFKTGSFYFFLTIWTSNLLIIGIPLDRLLFGSPLSGYLTLTFLISFIIAYPLSILLLRSLSNTKSVFLSPIFIAGLVLNILSVILGFIFIFQSFKGIKIPWFGNSWEMTCSLGIFTILFGSLVFGVLIASVVLYRKLKKPEGISIWNRTDNHNLFICLRNLLLAVFVIWIVIIIILVLLFLSDGGDIDLGDLSFGSSSKKKKKTNKKRK
ncbi:MAG: hypothetical protein GF329_04675 [Candidatus Lokiarchaeota archaeon]|nr:hypothetical protein [Candidatus Lokiarchaeota archaeon]